MKSKIDVDTVLMVPVKDLSLRQVLMHGDFTGHTDKTAAEALGYGPEHFRHEVYELHKKGITVKGLKHEFKNKKKKV